MFDVDLQVIEQMPFASQQPPAGKTGLLPRTSKPGEWFGYFRDHQEVIDPADWDAYQTEKGLIPFIPHVFRQKYNSCGSESCTSGMLVTKQFAGQPFTLLNPLFLYHYASGGYDRGSGLDTNLRVAREKGCAPDSVWPYSKGFRQRPSEEAHEAALENRIFESYEITSKNEAVSAILQGFVVAMGSDGHAVLGIHHYGDYPLILNTWGTGWGSNGVGKWASSYQRLIHTYGAFAYRYIQTSNLQNAV